MKHLKDWLERLKSRSTSGDYWEDRRHHEALETLATVSDEGEWIKLSGHSNGFVREVAVRELSKQSSPATLAALLERVNDWVPQVRKLATEGVRQYLAVEHAQALLYALPQIMALAECQRADHGPTLAAARSALQAAQVRNQVEAAFISNQGKTARFLFELLLEVSDGSPHLLEKALAHREMIVRQLAVLACQALQTEQAVPLLQQALNTPGASVRVRAVQVLLQRLDDPRVLLRSALLDASAAVRNLALWAAPRWQIDARCVLDNRLQQSIPQSKREWLGLLGLANDLGARLDGDWLAAALHAPQSNVRLAAVGNLDDTHLNEQLAALDDAADKVFALAVQGLSRQSWTVLAEPLQARLDRDWHQFSAARCGALMHMLPRWQQLAYLLRRLDNDDADDYWLTLIAQWCQQQYLMVDPTTAKDERTKLLERVRYLESRGELPSGCTARLT